jgi:aldehyde:ferredoxin oxidoreductase
MSDEAALRESVRRLAKQLTENLAGMSKFGTGALVAGAEEVGSLPLKNWKGTERWTEEALKITGVTMANTILSGRYGCERCVVRCGREVKFTDPRFGDFAGAGPEYETLGSLGSLCLVSDLNAICLGNDLCNRYGLDTISAGAAVAFAMEAYEKGIITAKDTDGLKLTWGNAEAMLETIKMIGEAQGLGAVLGKGVRLAARELGGGSEKFAVHAHGLEAPMHDPRTYVSLGLGYTTSNRGACHVAGFSHTFERVLAMPEIGYPQPLDRLAVEGKAEMTAKGQHVMGMMDSLKTCKFMLFGKLRIADMGDWYKSITGKELSVGDFMLTGERIFNLKRLFNLMCGLSPAEDVVLPRLQDTPKDAPGWKNTLTPFPRLIKEYYQARGWDQKGLPIWDKLKELGLEEEGRVLKQAGKL